MELPWETRRIYSRGGTSASGSVRR